MQQKVVVEGWGTNRVQVGRGAYGTVRDLFLSFSLYCDLTSTNSLFEVGGSQISGTFRFWPISESSWSRVFSFRVRYDMIKEWPEPLKVRLCTN